MIVISVVAYFVGKNIKKIPSKTQTFFETAFSFALGYIEEVLESRELAKRFFPLIATLFIFILMGNWFGLLPGVGSLYIEKPVEVEASESKEIQQTHEGTTYIVPEGQYTEVETHHVELFHPTSVDLNFTLALAIVSFFIVEISGILYVGALHYAGKFFNFKSVIGFFVGIIELFSELARLVSFSFRLFGNMFAGKTLIIVATFFIPLIVPVPLMVYEIFVGLIQASIFSILTLFFIKLAISEVH
jgi:F-type H+-transporting ATPase subunit a